MTEQPAVCGEYLAIFICKNRDRMGEFGRDFSRRFVDWSNSSHLLNNSIIVRFKSFLKFKN